jgi:hypothetical protein
MLPEDLPWVDLAVKIEYGGEGSWFAKHSDPAVITDNVPELWNKVKMGG